MNKTPIFTSTWFSFTFTTSSSVAQWKRAGPITQRSMDRNHPLLSFFFYKLMNFSFFVPWRFHHPLIAQLVERRTVVGFAMQTSLGRWFESGSRGNFFCSMPFAHCLSSKKNCAPGEARTHDLQITLALDSL